MHQPKQRPKTSSRLAPQDTPFSTAKDSPRRLRTSLYVVIFDVRDAVQRSRVRRIIASFGFEVAPGAFEVPTSATGASALERAITPELQAGDSVRIYPVCSRCRGEARLWGEGELAGLSPALIY
jgi:CRISPR-associated endonuclease Cas2